MIEAQREEWRAEGVQIAADAPRTLGEQVLSIQDRLRPAHRLMRRLQRIGAQAVSALWPGLPAPRTPSRTADWLEVAAGRLEAWKGSAARAGAPSLGIRQGVVPWARSSLVSHVPTRGAGGAGGGGS